MFKKMSTLFVIAILATGACFAHVADTRENRVTAVKGYLKVMNTEQMLNEMVNAFSITIPEDQKDTYKAIMQKYFNASTIERVTMETMPDFFTVSEIEDLTAFYATQNGQSILTKMGPFSQAVGTKMVQELFSNYAQIQEEFTHNK